MTKTAAHFVVGQKRPSYLDAAVQSGLPTRVAAAREELRCCRSCPRNCKIDRLAGETKVCGTGRYARVFSAFPHHGEEDCLRGRRGSGTIFFSSCNLKCVFCQNWDISQRPSGREMDATGIAALMLALQEQGCHNINFVSPAHVVPQIIEALARAINDGFHLPVVYNTNAYDSLSSLKLLDGLVDIYMPDFKFWTPATAEGLSMAGDYPARAREAITEMHRQTGDLGMDADGVACHGLLVRHLVMPGQLEESRRIFRWLADEISPHTFVNIMGQYRPAYQVGGVAAGSADPAYAEINRPSSRADLAAAYESARNAGLWRFDRPPAW